MSQEIAQTTSTRTNRWRVALVAVSGVLLLGGGYLIGAAQAPDSVGSSSSAVGSGELVNPPIELGSSGAQDGGGTAEGEMADADEDTESMAAGDSAWYGGWGGNSVFTGGGFSNETSTAMVYGFDARTAATQEAAQRLVDALGMTGTPTLSDGSWTLENGEDTYLALSLDATASFSYWSWDQETDPYAACDWIWEEQTEEISEAEAQELDQKMNDCLAENAPDLPSADEAIFKTRDLMAQIGLSPENYTFESPEYPEEDYGPQFERTVIGRRMVADQTTSVEIYAQWRGDSLVGINGGLAEPVSLGDYPIVSEAEAMERLTDPRFGVVGISGDGGIEPAEYEEWVPPTQAPATPDVGAAVDWYVSTVNLTSVRLGLSQVWQSVDDSVRLVPAYEFTAENGFTYSVIALADSALNIVEPEG